LQRFRLEEPARLAVVRGLDRIDAAALGARLAAHRRGAEADEEVGVVPRDRLNELEVARRLEVARDRPDADEAVRLGIDRCLEGWDSGRLGGRREPAHLPAIDGPSPGDPQLAVVEPPPEVGHQRRRRLRRPQPVHVDQLVAEDLAVASLDRVDAPAFRVDPALEAAGDGPRAPGRDGVALAARDLLADDQVENGPVADRVVGSLDDRISVDAGGDDDSRCDRQADRQHGRDCEYAAGHRSQLNGGANVTRPRSVGS
jgi:hypothetical protein